MKKRSTELDKKSDYLIKDFYHSYAKEDSFIKFSEILQMFLEKNILTNKYSFNFVLSLYTEFAPDEGVEMTQPQFVAFFIKVSFVIFSQAANPIEEMINFMLKEKLNFKNWKGRVIR